MIAHADSHGAIVVTGARLINETYSAFVQGFMPPMARADVVGLEGVTAAIVVEPIAGGPGARESRSLLWSTTWRWWRGPIM